jgi:membrane protease YdiL (CAAX protease family)
MNSESELPRVAPTLWSRVSQFPLVRIALAILSVAIPFIIVSVPLNLFVSDKLLRRLGALVLAALVLACYWGYVRIVEKRAVAELSGRRAAPELAFGLLIGALLLTLTVGVLAASGVYQVIGNNGWQAMFAILPSCILAGVFEEVLIRGIVFRILEQWLGSWIALGISAGIFGVLHLLNPGATLLNAAAISIEAGVLLAAAYMLTRRLWLCIGIHTAWNFTQGGIFSVAVSGGAAKGLLQARLVGPDWLTGGTFGAEASLVAVVVCGAAGIIFIVAAVRKGHIIPVFSRVAHAAARV